MDARPSEERIRRHVQHLAGVLGSRGPNTENERSAAQYIRQRFEQHHSRVAVEEFSSPDTFYPLLASYYAEFTVVSVLATWLPSVALVYGLVVFGLYIAEITGYRVVSRLLPEFTSQNVFARHPGARARRTVVVTAHYDTGKDTPLATAGRSPWLRNVHYALIACMLLVLFSCLAQSQGLFEENTVRPDYIVRWAGAMVLLTAAGWLGLHELASDQRPGANDNASGVAALLELNEQLNHMPLPHCDVWLVATGSKEGWLNGIRHFITHHQLDHEYTYFINIERVGVGQLHYVTAEGVLHPFDSDSFMVKQLEAMAGAYGMEPCMHHGLPTDAYLPAARGYKTVSLMAAPPDMKEGAWDSVAQIDAGLIARAADAAYNLMQRIDATAAPNSDY